MTIDILTLFPEMFAGVFSTSIIGRAQKQGLASIRLHNFREYATDKHQTVDDSPYGGGAGMVLKVDVLVTALEAILGRTLPDKLPTVKIILLSAKAKQFTQAQAQSFAHLDRLVLICGHYEGVDERIMEFIDEELSVGEFVVTGGEIPAMLVADALVRLLPGAITQTSTLDESHTQVGVGEYPHYTRPEVFRGQVVPPVLLSGDHKKIAAWRVSRKNRV